MVANRETGLQRGGDAPLFSILIPCYNVEKYVEECISSVESQTYGSWEMVAVDDGSTDGTPAILDSLASRIGPRMRVVHQENCGLLLARRSALSLARGEYVAFLDSDDALRNDALEIVAESIAEHPGALVQFRLSRESDFGGNAFPDYPGSPVLPARVDVAAYRRWVCAGSAFNNLCSKAIPAAASGADEDYSAYSHVRNAEDLLQLAGVLDSVSEVVLLGDALYYYRPNPGSITHTFQPGFYDSVRAANGVLRERVGRWGDGECLRLFYGRWLGAVHSSLVQLSGSGYPLRRMAEECRRIGGDDMFREAWESRGRLGRGQSLLLGMLARGEYGRLALALWTAGRLGGRAR